MFYPHIQRTKTENHLFAYLPSFTVFSAVKKIGYFGATEISESNRCLGLVPSFLDSTGEEHAKEYYCEFAIAQIANYFTVLVLRGTSPRQVSVALSLTSLVPF